MKFPTLIASSFLLVAAPVAAIAQDSNGNNNGNAGTSGSEQTNTAGQEKSDCSDTVVGSKFESFSEKCRTQIEKWTGEQPVGRNVHYEGDIAVGAVLPESVEIIEVPAYQHYGYVMLNNKRVLVDRDTHTIVRVY